MIFVISIRNYIYDENLNLGCIFDTAGRRDSSTFCRVDRLFDFINANAENAASHKYVVQNGRSMFRAISESVGNSVLIQSQNSFN